MSLFNLLWFIIAKNYLLRIFYKKTVLSLYIIEILEQVFKGLSSVIFAEGFPVRQQSQYSMRNNSYFAMPLAKMINYGSESLSYIV